MLSASDNYNIHANKGVFNRYHNISYLHIPGYRPSDMYTNVHRHSKGSNVRCAIMSKGMT